MIYDKTSGTGRPQADNNYFWRSSEGGRWGLKERGSMGNVIFFWTKGIYIDIKPLKQTVSWNIRQGL